MGVRPRDGVNTPRVVIAGTASGAGKTSVACGVIGALRARGMAVQGFKVGPDYIDPSYHRMASGRSGRNLDAFLCGPELMAPLFRHGAQGADIAVIEGVMGLFDGVTGHGELASTAHVAKLLGAPVVLVVDGSSIARSVAAVVHGYRSFDPDVDVVGVILNRLGSEYHEQILRDAIAPLGIPVVGALRRDSKLRVPERHLGLVPADEWGSRSLGVLDALADRVARHVDLDAIVTMANRTAAVTGPAWSPEPPSAPARARVAIAIGPAFSFHYAENLELLAAAGAELVPFDPLSDERLPEGTDGLILAGGFPEVFAKELSANVALRTEVAAFARSGRPVVAECGGLLYLCHELDGHPMCGVIPARGRMAGRLTLGYRDAEVLTATTYLGLGERLRGHEFHHSVIDALTGWHDSPAWMLSARGTERPEGFAAAGVHASYLHVHWAAQTHLAARLVHASTAVRAGGS